MENHETFEILFGIVRSQGHSMVNLETAPHGSPQWPCHFTLPPTVYNLVSHPVGLLSVEFVQRMVLSQWVKEYSAPTRPLNRMVIHTAAARATGEVPPPSEPSSRKKIGNIMFS